MPAQDLISLRNRLKLKSQQSELLLKTHHPHAVAQLEAAGVRPGSIRKHAAKLLAAGATATALMTSPLTPIALRAALPAASQSQPLSPDDLHLLLKDALKDVLPTRVDPLTPAQEEKISELLYDYLGIHAYAQLEGNRLNHSYGLIGAEQHLPRYPGDTLEQHGAYLKAGITPGLGAWRYFARSKSEMTPDLIAKERYYVAVQTLYLPDWHTRLAYLRDWYKYRKVAVVNPKNGKAVIAVVADSGPASWTGKHFGGSPEVMAYLEAKDGRQRGPVVLFFIDDPEDRIPLGPIDYNLEKPSLLQSI
ncbi:MAG: hypothetical protein UX59_C0022G0006 [Microgenomates group bacterium GW2011_GWA1_46_7]|nr:MAG: hypothetical protein UX59_C0022G0006 [Microgenomates group bacterium GW2011_GWA1_46_7]